MTIAVLTDQYSKSLALSLSACFTPRAEVLIISDKDEALQTLRDYKKDFPFAIELDTDKIVTPS